MQWNSLNSLFAKIFSVFWLLIALLISALILLPQLDGRQLQPASNNDKKDLAHKITLLNELIDKNPILTHQSLLQYRLLKCRLYALVCHP